MDIDSAVTDTYHSLHEACGMGLSELCHDLREEIFRLEMMLKEEETC